jgi:hypothetical protein
MPTPSRREGKEPLGVRVRVGLAEFVLVVGISDLAGREMLLVTMGQGWLGPRVGQLQPWSG